MNNIGRASRHHLSTCRLASCFPLCILFLDLVELLLEMRELCVVIAQDLQVLLAECIVDRLPDMHTFLAFF